MYNVPIFRLHSCKHVLMTVQLHPRSLGLFILVLSQLHGEYTDHRLPILMHRAIHSGQKPFSVLSGTILLLLWFKVADQTIPITCCRSQCMTNNQPCTSHCIAHHSPGIEPQTFITTQHRVICFNHYMMEATCVYTYIISIDNIYILVYSIVMRTKIMYHACYFEREGGGHHTLQ